MAIPDVYGSSFYGGDPALTELTAQHDQQYRKDRQAGRVAPGADPSKIQGSIPNYPKHYLGSAIDHSVDLYRSLFNGLGLTAQYGLNYGLGVLQTAPFGTKYKNFLTNAHRGATDWLTNYSNKVNVAANNLIADDGIDYTNNGLSRAVKVGATAAIPALTAATIGKRIFSGAPAHILMKSAFPVSFGAYAAPRAIDASEAAFNTKMSNNMTKVVNWAYGAVRPLDKLYAPLYNNIGSNNAYTSMKLYANPAAYDNYLLGSSPYKYLADRIHKYTAQDPKLADLLDEARSEYLPQTNNTAEGVKWYNSNISPVLNTAAWVINRQIPKDISTNWESYGMFPFEAAAVNAYTRMNPNERKTVVQRVVPELVKNTTNNKQLTDVAEKARDQYIQKAIR